MKINNLYILLCFCWLLVWSSANAQDNNIRLQLKWWHQFQFAGFYAAEIRGFYKEEGLKVTLIPGDKNHQAVDEVLSGSADYGISDAELILDFSLGKPVEALGVIFQHSPYIIISLEKSRLNSPGDLIGKKIMASKGQGWIQLQAALMKEGIPLDSLKIIEHTWNNNDLISGNADAMSGYTSVEPFQLQKIGYKTAKIYPVNYGIDFYGDLLFSTQKTVKNHPERTQKFLKASYRGWEYAMSHPEELADYILTLPGVKERNVTKAELLFEAEEMAKLILPQLVEIGHMNEGRWQHILDVHKSLKLISQKQQLDGFIYVPNKISEHRLLNIIFYIVTGSLILLGLGILYGISLRRAVANRTNELEKEIIIRRQNEIALSNLSTELQGSYNDLIQFAYLTSHNLRAPVSNLLSLTQLFDKVNLSEKNLIYFEKIATSTTMLNNMLAALNEILSARTIKHDETDLQLVSFKTFLQNVQHSMAEEIQQTNTLIKADFSEAPQIISSNAILQSIFVNLLNNAIKFRNPGVNPEITIRSYKKEQGTTILEFADNSTGTDLYDRQDKLFSIAQRLNANTDGKGLGLYLLNYQVEKNGGSINVQSRLNTGTVFTIFLKNHEQPN